MFHQEKVVVVLAGDGTDLRLLVFGTGGGEIELIILLTRQHRAELRSAGVELIHAVHLVAGRVLPPSGSQFATLYAVEGQLTARLILRIDVVVLDRLGVGSGLVLHLGQTEIDDAIRVVVADGVHVATGGLARIVDQSVALGHAESDIPSEIPLLG